MEIIYLDDHLVAVNKPTGMLVHRTDIAADVTAGFALQTVRDQIGKKVFPVHRIDRPTSGVLLFALSPAVANAIRQQFDQHLITKEYLAIVRGHLAPEGKFDFPLKKENGQIQEAITTYKTLEKITLPVPNDRYPTTRYSLVLAMPMNGRMHQIRRHFAKNRNYILGDTTYGNLKANRALQAHCQAAGLLLHAAKLSFEHPISKERIQCKCDLPDRFMKVLGRNQPNKNLL